MFRKESFIIVIILFLFVLPNVTQAQFIETDLLRASNFGAQDQFGWSVALDDDRLVIGARGEDGPSNNTDGSGAAYVFKKRPNNTWEEEQVLRNFDKGDQFGFSVAIEDSIIAVGARANGGPSEDEGYAGAVYIFNLRTDGVWEQTEVIRASNYGSGDGFGWSVDLDDNFLLVGAQGENGPLDNTSGAGAAYVFEQQSDGTWQEQQILRASNFDSSDGFGYDVAIDESRLVVSAIEEDGPSDNTSRAGAAYVFERQPNGTWQEFQLLRASNFGADDTFGFSVDIWGERVLVGARLEDGPSDTANDAGAAYIFSRQSDGSWDETQILRGSNAEAEDQFGASVTLGADTLAVAAHHENGPSNSISDAGATYVFESQSGGTWQESQILRASNAGPDDDFGWNAMALDGGQLLIGAFSEAGPSNNNDGAGAAYTFQTSSTIPVELAEFNIRKQSEKAVLSWQTASEQNNAGFEVQRRVASGWKSISFIEGAGTTSKPQTYRFQDSNLPFEVESVNYRLKQIDTDGSTSFSGTRTLKIGAPDRVSLHATFPNPAQSQVTLRYALPRKSDVSIRIYDVLGRRVETIRRGTEDAGRKEVQVSTSGLSPGTYFVRMQAGEKMETKQLTVVR